MNHSSDSHANDSHDPQHATDAPQESLAQELEQALPIQEHEEEETVDGRPVRRRGIYLLPNLLTTGALFSGFYAILAGMNGHFEVAAIAIFVAMVFDGLDGRVARLTNTQSAFGVQYDSLSDMVSFGVAPAVVSFSWGLNELGKLGWAVAFIYVSCAALRLARFNTQVGTVDSRFFIGLASPAAAALVAAMVWAGHDTEIGVGLALVAAVITGVAGILMVLNVRYHSFKGLDLRGRVPFVMILVAVFVFVVVSIDPPKMLLLLGLVYAASGPVAQIVRRLRRQTG
ncbi:CDP-diacylglycerol--serine O-phosphatidyltransferase [Porticoccus sp. GXU_MW_L64]